MKLARLISLLSVAVVAACAGSGSDSGRAGNTEINLDIVAPGTDEAISPFSIDRVDYRVTCGGGSYLLPPYARGTAGENGDPCSVDDLNSDGIPDVCPPGSNYIAGTGGPDNLVGTNGVDCIFGFGGNDTIDGGNKDDHICGGPGDDQLLGGNGNDLLVGQTGDDALNGENGDDSLDGGPGTDTLDGGSGPDICVEEVAGQSTRLTNCENSYSDAVDIQGSFEVVDTRSPPVWQTVMDLPPGDCTITLSVFEDDEIVCVGSQTLAIVEDGTTKYDIVLVCSLSIDTPDGMADVDGTFEFITGNICPKLYVLNALGEEFLFGRQTFEVQYRAKDPDNSCGNNCDPQTCNGANPPVCTPYPSNIQDPICNPQLGGDPNDPSCLDGSNAGLVCTIAAFPTASPIPGAPAGTFFNPLTGTPVGPVLPVNLNTAANAIAPGLGIILPGLGGPLGTDSEGSPVFQFPTDSLPALIYECDPTLQGTTIINLTCSDGDLECDQNKQTSIICGTSDFCIDDPFDCTGSGECLTDGVCDPSCDPFTGCERCIGQDDPVADGTICSEGGGQLCLGGACVECIADADCVSVVPQDECQLPPTCDASNVCVAGGAAPAGTPCDRGGGLGPGECSGTGTGTANCEFVVVDPAPATQAITLGCTNNLTLDISILPWSLEADPGLILDGQPVSIDYTGTAFFTETFLDAGLAAVPGLNSAALAPGNRGGATIVEYGGGLAGPNVEIQPAPIPTTCDGGMNAGGACTVDSDCPPVGYFNCLEIVQLPILTTEIECDALGPPKDTQFDDNGFCIAGPLPLPLENVTGNYTAVGGNPINLGWDESNFVSINTDGTYQLPAASFAAPWQPNGLRVVVGVLQIALNCNMAVDSGGPDGVGVPDQASPTPTSALLNDFSVQIP